MPTGFRPGWASVRPNDFPFPRTTTGPIPPVIMRGNPGTFILREASPPRGHAPNQFEAYMLSYPLLTAGVGGWSRIARPRRRALTEWVGRDSVSLTIEFLSDALYEERGPWNEANIESLELMAGVGLADNQPPLCRLESKPPGLMPHGLKRDPDIKWFIETLSYDKESIIVGDEGNRLRCGGTLVVTQWIPSQTLSPARRRRDRQRQRGGGSDPGGGGHRKTYVVKAGDTLTEIAARKDVYGDASKWKKIATANHIRDPKDLKTGQKLKIP